MAAAEGMGDFVPRYFEIEQALRARVAESEPGDTLPSEAALCAMFNVSRMTARRAVQRLAEEGLVYRERGRGTFVAEPQTRRQANLLLSFSEEMRLIGKQASSRLLESGMVPANADEARALQIPAKDDVVLVRRVRLADGTPIALERSVLVPASAPVLETDLASGSLHRALTDLHLLPTRGRANITADGADAEDASHLDVDRGEPLLIERRLIRDQHGSPLELAESRYVAARYSMDVEFDVGPVD